MERYKYSYIVVLLLLSVVGTGYGQSPSTTYNFVMESTVKVPGKITLSSLSGLPVSEINRAISYFDGLGRPAQTVIWKGSPDQYDIVNTFSYDELGRPLNTYLPYRAAGSDASFQISADAAAVSYYQGVHAGVMQTSYPFSKTVYEPSPLNRIAQQGFPGASWQPLNGSVPNSGHTRRTEYKVNTAADTVRLWSINGTTVSSTGSYAAGQLSRTTSKDENWTGGAAGTVDEFKDLEGQLICKRVWESSTVARSTYYVFDEFNRLRYVIPPGVSASPASISIAMPTGAGWNDFVYAYHYDDYGRVIEKKTPSKGWEEMVYDKLDRLVMSRDALQAASGKWLFSKHDTLERLIMTGLATSSDSRSVWQSAFDGASKHCELRDNSNSSGTGMGYTNAALPSHSIVQYYYTINYYDDYNFYGNSFGGISPGQSAAVNGLLTGSKVNVLGGNTMLLTTNYYNGKGEAVQSKKQNHLGGTDITDNSFNFTGQLTSSRREHTVSGQTTVIYQSYEYDHLGRKTKTYEKIGNAGSANVVLSELVYNEVGQLKDKKLNNGGTTVQHAYNERGWLIRSSSPQFEMQLKYADGLVPQYNGNIADQFWGTAGSLTKSYTYSYDQLDRLINAISGSGNHEKDITYDPMGNIRALRRDNGTLQSYAYSGNRLSSVSGGLSRSYSYDVNGNATTAGPNTFTYNFLNLPATANGTVSFTYDAGGKKLSRSYGGLTTHYVDGIQYTGNTIDFILTEEGFARRNTATEYIYHYNLDDHLGNTRLTFNQNSSIVQYDDYYPFGKTFNSYVSGHRNNYLYNGKELQDGISGNATYDYGARFYDSEVGRWNMVDPLVEEMVNVSPYNYVLNNPIRSTDPDGRAPTDIVIYGKNNSSVTIKTNLIDIKVNAGGLGVNFGGNYTLRGDDILQASLDIVGVFDPTGIADGINAGISARNGNWGDAIISGVGLIPYAGDLAKAGKIKKDIKIIDEAVNALQAESKLAKKGEKAASKIEIDDVNKIDRGLLNPPKKAGNAPTFKKDGKPVDIHHEGQQANGPFKEMHPNDHRTGSNYRKNHPKGQKPLSKDERKQFNKDKKKYWREEFPES